MDYGVHDSLVDFLQPIYFYCFLDWIYSLSNLCYTPLLSTKLVDNRTQECIIFIVLCYLFYYIYDNFSAIQLLLLD